MRLKVRTLMAAYVVGVWPNLSCIGVRPWSAPAASSIAACSACAAHPREEVVGLTEVRALLADLRRGTGDGPPGGAQRVAIISLVTPPACN